ncbi:MAG: hypothetical protein SFV23_09670 [Planctomycetaceae bacterium]|nr:hypothetical protein [Planctomycetaceae bacterium]
MAWAERRHVKLPDFVLAAAADEQRCAPTSQRSCCAKKRTAPSASTRSANPGSAETSVVIGVLAQECQGQRWFWNALPWSVLPPRVVELLPGDDLFGRSVLISEACPDRTLPPPVPPPRIAAV